MSLLNQLEQDFRKQGYEVYSKHLKGLEPRPPDWKGVFPDLIAVKPAGRIAVFVETSKTLGDPLTPERWRNSEQVNEAALQLFVYKPREKALLERMLQQEGIGGKVGLVRKAIHRQRVPSVPATSSGRLALVLLVIVVLGCLLVWMGSLLYEYQVDYHEPRDMEREQLSPLP